MKSGTFIMGTITDFLKVFKGDLNGKVTFTAELFRRSLPLQSYADDVTK